MHLAEMKYTYMIQNSSKQKRNVKIETKNAELADYDKIL